MLILTKLDNSKILVNLSSVKYFQAVPDTVVFFLNGDKMMVRESLPEIMHLTDGKEEAKQEAKPEAITPPYSRPQEHNAGATVTPEERRDWI